MLADPQHIVISSGVTQAIALLGQTLRTTPLAMEDPGFWQHRMILRHNGVEPIPVPIDGEGLDVDALASSGAEVVLTTPAHQSPTGVVLSAPRRTALMEWARAGHLVIEDDYDAEYRYDRAPVGSLQGIAPDRVVYVGSTSKTLAPGLRIGWMVLPPHLAKAVISSKWLADTGGSVMDQVAFAQFLTSGEYDRHLRQMRRRYHTRRTALLDALARHLPDATVLGAAAGVHLTVRFPDAFPLDDLVAHAKKVRVRVEPVARCYAEPVTAPPGLLLGYANLTESQIERGVRRWLGRFVSCRHHRSHHHRRSHHRHIRHRHNRRCRSHRCRYSPFRRRRSTRPPTYCGAAWLSSPYGYAGCAVPYSFGDICPRPNRDG